LVQTVTGTKQWS